MNSDTTISDPEKLRYTAKRREETNLKELTVRGLCALRTRITIRNLAVAEIMSRPTPEKCSLCCLIRRSLDGFAAGFSLACVLGL